MKAALRIIGIDAGVPRGPLAPASEEVVVQLKQAVGRLQEVSA